MTQAPISSSERIRELWAINADVPTLLSSASKAINALTDRPTSTSSDDKVTSDAPTTDNLAAHKQAFTDSSRAYFNNLQSILARLRRSVYALEEAGIIEPDAPIVSNSREAGEKGESEGDKVTNGGLGNLDVGTLNSRVNGVQRLKEVELLGEARDMLRDATRSSPGGS